MNYIPFITLLFISLSATSQTIPVYNTISTPYGPQRIQTGTAHYPHHYNNGWPTSAELTSVKRKFEIVFKNDSSVTSVSQIDLAISPNYITVIDKEGNEYAIIPKKTNALYCFDKDGLRIVGIPSDSCWLFKVSAGKITGYAPAPDSDKYMIAIQISEDSPIIPLTRENLMPLISTNPKAVELAEKGRLAKAVVVFNQKKNESEKRR